MIKSHYFDPLPALQSQRDRFIEAARAAGTDEAAFKAKLAVIAKQKPKGNGKHTPEKTRKK